MKFDLLDSLSLAGDTAKQNEDSFGHAARAAVVFDGATGLGESLMPGRSDPAWLAQFGARRLLAHLGDGDAPIDALRAALGDAEKSFEALRRRPPKENYENPYASMMLVCESSDGLDALWFGDCAALISRPGEAVEIVGEAFDKRVAESRRVRMLADAKGLAPASGVSRPEFMGALRAARNSVNTDKGGYLFGPDARAADYVAQKTLQAPAGTVLLLVSDGFLALASDYGAYDAETLIEAAQSKGLAALGEELRAIEEADAEGHKFARFKKSDDATAVLVRLK